jgi:hypothetical protein
MYKSIPHLNWRLLSRVKLFLCLIAPLFLTSALDGGEWWASCPGRFTPQGKSPLYPLEWRLGGPQSSSGCCGAQKNPLPLPGHPAHSLSLYWLKYPGSKYCLNCIRFENFKTTHSYIFSKYYAENEYIYHPIQNVIRDITDYHLRKTDWI